MCLASSVVSVKTQYQQACQQMQQVLQAHPLTLTLKADTHAYWQSWAQEMVTKFQCTTAAVEGRNGYLIQVHHSRRGLSARQLQVMTVIHNFDLQRADGTTAAQRLFKQAHPNLFETVWIQMPDLPLLRKHSKPSNSQILVRPSVPA